jgi:hypothetical protein
MGRSREYQSKNKRVATNQMHRVPEEGPWLDTRTNQEFKRKRDGEAKRATEVLEELEDLRTLVSPGRDLYVYIISMRPIPLM